jgi:two-component system, response regulator / RNA-binding antiterminator
MSATAPTLRVLLVDDGAHHVTLIRDELTRLGYVVVGVIDSATLIHDCVLQLAPDIVIVDSESPTRDTLEHLAVLSSQNPRPVVVFAADDSTDPLHQALRAGVSAYVVDGLQPHRLAPVLKVAIARFAQDKALRAQLDEAQTQLSNRKQIERAKGILMARTGCSEDQAYTQLRKLAMDRGQRLSTMAERLIEASELLPPSA